MNTPLHQRRSVRVAAGILVIPVLALTWWLAAPLFQDEVVDEAFPIAAEREAPVTDTGDGEAVSPTTTVHMDDTEMTDPATDGEAMTEEEDAAVTGPVVVLTGEIVGADAAHQGTGTATIYRLEHGSHVLRLEDFEVTNGPDLHVFLTPVADPSGRDDVMAPGYVDLGELKGNIGDQNYELPADIDLDAIGSVVIYCVPFHVLFAGAPLTA